MYIVLQVQYHLKFKPYVVEYTPYHASVCLTYFMLLKHCDQIFLTVANYAATAILVVFVKTKIKILSRVNFPFLLCLRVQSMTVC